MDKHTAKWIAARTQQFQREYGPMTKREMKAALVAQQARREITTLGDADRLARIGVLKTLLREA